MMSLGARGEFLDPRKPDLESTRSGCPWSRTHKKPSTGPRGPPPPPPSPLGPLRRRRGRRRRLFDREPSPWGCWPSPEFPRLLPDARLPSLEPLFFGFSGSLIPYLNSTDEISPFRAGAALQVSARCASIPKLQGSCRSGRARTVAALQTSEQRSKPTMFVGLAQALNCPGLSAEALAKFKNDAMKRRK